METTLWIEIEGIDLNFDLFSLCMHQLDPKTGLLTLVFKGGYSRCITDKELAQNISDIIKKVRAAFIQQQKAAQEAAKSPIVTF